MRKITQESVNAFMGSKPFKKSNMAVTIENGITYLKLHNNKIAAMLSDGRVWISSAGWRTNTTKERLNGIPGVRVNQKNYQWFVNGIPWSGEPVYINQLYNTGFQYV
jgi:hypothetical protein